MHNSQNIAKHNLLPVLTILLAGLLIFTMLVSCERKESKTQQGTQPSPLSDPMEAKKKQLANIFKELVPLAEQIEKNPNLLKDPAINEKGKKLSDEADTLIEEITGGDSSKEETVVIESVKKYAPEHLEVVKKWIADKKIAVTKTRLKVIRMALEQYRLDFATYPGTEEGLNVLAKQDDTQRLPYLSNKEDLKDGWNQPFIYRLKDINENEYDLYSIGPNGKDENGRGDDIT